MLGLSPENLVLGIAAAAVLASGCALTWWTRRIARGRAAHRRLALLCASGLTLAFLVSLLALAGESYFRFLHDATDSFAFSRSSVRWFERHYTLNQSTFRDNVEYFAPREPGMPRISFLGDSFTEGQGIRDVEQRFVNRIRRERPGWEVHGICRAALETGGETEMLGQVLAAGYQIDRVVLAYCLNDISDLVPTWGEFVQRLGERQRSRGWLLKHSYLADALYLRILVRRDPSMRDYFGQLRGAYTGQAWVVQQARLDQLIHLVQASGGSLLVVVFPFIHALGEDYAFSDAHRALADYWKSRGIPALDLLSTYAGKEPADLRVNARDAHPNELANELAAKAILPFLDAHISASGAGGSTTIPR